LIKTISGKAHKYESDNIDTDVILPGPYLKIHDHKELAKHAMEGIDPTFPQKVSKGDLLVTGANFGCGSSREHAAIALSQAGISAVLAPSFARIFYRNAIDGGHLLPIEVTADTVKKISNGDQLEITLSTNKIRNRTKNEEYEMRPLQDLIAKIVEAGGLLNYRRV
jgi:3-isopropylmalate/(R)-2-methylmalate dehydratase small subunit